MRLALSQYGCFSLAQAQEIGVGKRCVHHAAAIRELVRDAPQVYRLSASPITWETRLMTAQLWLGAESVISQSSAAALWKLPTFCPGPVELSTPRPKKALPPVVVHKVGADLSAHTTTVGPFRVTNAGRTLVDIAGKTAPDVLERALEDAIRRRLTSMRHLEWLMRDRHGRGAKGIRTLKELLSPMAGVTDSDFEVRLFQALRRSSLPLPTRQYTIFDGERPVGRVDFAYPWAKVVIEADSYQFHSGRQAWEHDLARRNDLTALGWLVLHVTYWQMKHDIDGVVNRIRNALSPSMVHK